MTEHRTPRWDYGRLAAFVASHHGINPDRVRLDVQPLRGGLVAAAVGLVRASWTDGSNRARATHFVCKWSAADRGRELAAYKALQPLAERGIAPRLLGHDPADDGGYYLYLEKIRPWRRWPWRDTGLAASVLEQLAWLHSNVPSSALEPAPAWDYEAELVWSAQATLESCEAAARLRDLNHLRVFLPPVRRLVAGMLNLRQQLRAESPPVVLHGDAHPSNAMVRLYRNSKVPILIDWGRTRVGIGLEDTASWLHSLGFWEPEARRRHDTLLCRYLAARGLATKLSSEVRGPYWIAGASNAMAGALRYHLDVARCEQNSVGKRATASRAALDWLRIVRRADVCVRS